MRLLIFAGAIALISSLATAQEVSAPKIVIPVPDPDKGRFLVASKGCVVCHSINGVGGRAGPELDPQADGGAVDPLEFAARMWRGAAAMAFLQSLEFGYQIDLSGREIADLAAFVSSADHRRNFTENDIPELIRGWTIDEPLPDQNEAWSDLGIDALTGRSNQRRFGNVARGSMLAERWCTTCHVVDNEGEGGDIGPAFPIIGARSDMTEERIREWLSVPHANMPEFINLDEDDLGDLAAYIMWLKP